MLADTYNDPTEGGIAYRILGQIHTANGAYQKAKAALERSMRILKSANNVYEVAKTKVTLAQTAIASDEIPLDNAQTLLARAIEVFENLDAQADLTQAQVLIRQTSLT